MKLLKENQSKLSNFLTYNDIDSSFKLRDARNKVMKFLKDPDVRRILDNYDFDRIYQEYFTVEDNCCTAFEIGYFTTQLYKMGIDPLKYLNYVPNNFLAYSDITDITIPDGIKSIGDAAFYECPNLQNIVIPASVSRIGRFAFGYHHAYASCKPRKISFKPNSQLTKICEETFTNANIHSISLPDKLEYIDARAFCSAGDFTEIELPPTVIEVGELAFALCDSITTIKINSNIKFGYDVFRGLYSNVTIYIPKNLWSPEYINHLTKHFDFYKNNFKTF